LHPDDDGAGGGVIAIDFPIEQLCAGAVRSEDDVVAVRALNLAATGYISQVRVHSFDENREVDLIRAWYLAVRNRNRALITEVAIRDRIADGHRNARAAAVAQTILRHSGQ